MKKHSHIFEYDSVVDLKTGKKGTIVYITEGNIEKDISEEYLFEPDDHSFFPEFREYSDLKKLD